MAVFGGHYLLYYITHPKISVNAKQDKHKDIQTQTYHRSNAESQRQEKNLKSSKRQAKLDLQVKPSEVNR